jgi:hypothetical protein
MKAPFVTNRLHFHSYPDNAVEAFKHLQIVRKKIFGESRESSAVPYIMLQVRMKDNREVKLVFLGCQFQYVMSCSVRTVVMSLTDHSDEELILFATNALQRISKHDEYIVDGLVRVDIFSNNDDNLVVNELESLEARWFSKNDKHLANCATYLQNYWENMIYKCFASLK